MILDYLSGSIRLKAFAADWRSAVRMSGELLVAVGAVSNDYVREMVETVQENGAYIVLAPGLAFPHARPSKSVRRSCFGVLTLKEPVRFGLGYYDPVDVLLPIAATDDESHLKLLCELSTVLLCPETVHRIRKALRPEEIISALKAAEK